MGDDRKRKAVDSAWNGPAKKAATGTPGGSLSQFGRVADGWSVTWAAPSTTFVPTQALGGIDRSATYGGGKDGNRSAGAPGPLRILGSTQENDSSVIVIVPGWCQCGNKLSEEVKQVLFGRATHTNTQGNATTKGPLTQCTSSDKVAEMVPPPAVRTVIVHILGAYGLYLASHMEGLAARAHLKRPETTFDPSRWNRGLIKERMGILLESAGPSSAKCFSCYRSADWIASCCLSKFCTYYMPDRFLQNHKRGYNQEACRAQGAIGLLNPQSYIIKEDMLCKREIVLQVEDEERGRTQQRDIFVVRSLLPLSDLWRRSRSYNKFTYFYHMNWDGELIALFKIRKELPFLK